MADKPDSDAGEGTIRIRLSAALEAEASARHDLATALAHERSLFRTMNAYVCVTGEAAGSVIVSS